MELSVIIVSYNVRYFLEQCLYSVVKSSENLECEIMVIDNNSSDGSCQMVRSHFKDVRLLCNNVNAGFAAACNQGIRIARGRYVLLLNPDTIVEEKAFERCINFMDKYPDAGALGVKMIDGKGRFLPESKRGMPKPGSSFFKIYGLSRLFPRSHLFNHYHFVHLDHSRTGKVEVISGAYMFLRMEALDKTGLLDEDYFMYGEDIDLSYRLINAGYSNYYFPEVRIVHFKGESTNKEDLKYVFHFYRAMLIFIRKYYANSNRFFPVYHIKLGIYLKAACSVIKRLLIKAIRSMQSLIRKIFAKSLRGISIKPIPKPRRTVIAGDIKSYKDIARLIKDAGTGNIVVGRISTCQENDHTDVLGTAGELDTLIRDYRIDEIVFAVSNMPVSGIIDLMNSFSGLPVSFKIATPGVSGIIGSNSSTERGEIYSIDNKAV
jgi:GT2 family glycosyltransferase